MFEQRRPDSTQGVFETLLVLDGEPVELEAHLERLRDSVAELYARDLPPGLTHEIREGCRGTDPGKARVTATPSGSTVLRTDPIGDFLPLSERNSPTAVCLHSLTLPGGLGPHKWVDRSILEEAEADLPVGGLALIVDPGGIAPSDGIALEASRANLFAVRKGALFTPPLDGRILPGITRARVLALAAEAGIEAHETTLTRDGLHEAEEVFLTGSVRGIEPVRTLDGIELSRAGDVSTRLTAELQRVWRGSRALVG